MLDVIGLKFGSKLSQTDIKYIFLKLFQLDKFVSIRILHEIYIQIQFLDNVISIQVIKSVISNLDHKNIRMT